jgi:hypothetical protein
VRQATSRRATSTTYTLLRETDSPSEEQFTLDNIAAELELEPRRANLFGAIDDAADGPADEADGQDEPPTRPTAPPREKGVRFIGLSLKGGTRHRLRRKRYGLGSDRRWQMRSPRGVN